MEEEEKIENKACTPDNLSGFLGIWRIERMLNTRVIVICDMKKGISERIDEIVLRWFGIVKMVHEKGVYGKPSCELTGKGY